MTLGRGSPEANSDDVLFDPSKLDVVARSPDRSTVYLYIASRARWTGSDAQINSLVAKIRAYVGYAADGQLAAEHPDLAHLPWLIIIYCPRDKPDARSSQLLSQVADVVRRYGGDLVVRTSL